MLEFFTKDDSDAIALLKKDHDKVKGLFEQFENTDDLRQKKKIAAQAIMELKIHATIEEEIFYPALRKQKVEKDLLNEADEEHHVAKLLIAELDQMNGSEDHWEAKFTVLSENIRHHIREEEGEMFTQARRTDVNFTAVGKQLLARKQQLMKNGVPVSAEEKMIAAQKKGSDDSPARTAQSTKTSGAKKPVKKTAAKTRSAAKPAKKVSASNKKAAGQRAKPSLKTARRVRG